MTAPTDGLVERLRETGSIIGRESTTHDGDVIAKDLLDAADAIESLQAVEAERDAQQRLEVATNGARLKAIELLDAAVAERDALRKALGDAPLIHAGWAKRPCASIVDPRKDCDCGVYEWAQRVAALLSTERSSEGEGK